AAVSAESAADDDVAEVADLALILTAFVGPRLPTEQRRVERDGLLVVRDLERDVIEPDRLPVRRFERRRRRCFAAGRALAAVLAAAVADLQVEAVRILDVKALEIVAAIVGDWCEAALAQLRLDFLRVPRLDAPAEAVERRETRRAWTAAAAR